MNCNMYNCYAVYSLMFTYFMYRINSTCMHAHVFTPLGIVFFFYVLKTDQFTSEVCEQPQTTLNLSLSVLFK